MYFLNSKNRIEVGKATTLKNKNNKEALYRALVSPELYIE